MSMLSERPDTAANEHARRQGPSVGCGVAGAARLRRRLPPAGDLRHERPGLQPRHVASSWAHPRCEGERLLINPFGWLYEEITASSLISIDLDGATPAEPAC